MKGRVIRDLSEEDKFEVKKLYSGIIFTLGQQQQILKLLDRLQNSYIKGYDGYPKSRQPENNLMTNWN
jgi:hypothetical protein